MIIGLTGRNGSGKGTVAAWLQARGCRYASLSDSIRQWLREAGQPISRETLTAAGRLLRREGGSGVLAERLLPRLAEGGDWVVDSIRNPEEVAVLRRRADFVLIEVRAAVETRYARLCRRGREGDAPSLADFLRQDRAEVGNSDPAAQRLDDTAILADRVVDNDGSEADLALALGRLWRDLGAGSDPA